MQHSASPSSVSAADGLPDRQIARVHRLVPSVKDYAWGSTTAAQALLGPALVEAVDGDLPEVVAEVWFGTHPGGMARTGQRPLLQVLDAPLPYLLKVLAAQQALSLQVHPTREQAAAGFAREQAAGVALSSAQRNYKDCGAKPELIVALTPFRALAGIRSRRRTCALIAALQVAELQEMFGGAPEVDDVARDQVWAQQVLSTLLRLDSARAQQLVRSAQLALVEPAGTHELTEELFRDLAAAASLVDKLIEAHGLDVGVLGALLLNDVTLLPGQGLFQDAGVLHAYVSGLGIEIMAASDNVLRGGLTVKHIDVEELLAVLDARPAAAQVLDPQLELHEHGAVRRWPVPVSEFALAQVLCDEQVDLAINGPTIVLVTDGSLQVGVGDQRVPVDAGEAALVVGSDALRLQGRGQAFVAGAPDAAA